MYRQMTEHERKRRAWLVMHPLFQPTEKKTAVCYLCGQRKRIGKLREVGNDVYKCKGGCYGVEL